MKNLNKDISQNPPQSPVNDLIQSNDSNECT